jgi:hypothetical protein
MKKKENQEKKEIKEEELFIPKTKHKGLKIMLAILLVAGLMVGGYFLYQYKFNNPKTIVKTVIADAKENFKAKQEELKKQEIYKVDGHIKLDSNIDDDTFKALKDLELLFNGEINQKDRIGNIDINTKYKNDNLVDMNLYYENDTTYLLLKDIYDKYLKIDNKEEDNVIVKVNINPNDVYVIYNSLLNALDKEIDKLEIKQENDTITIGGKERKVINNYIELKDKEVNNLSKSILNTLKNDKEFIEAINNITGENYLEKLEETEDSINEEEFVGTYKINFYTDRGIFKKKIVSTRQTITQNGMAAFITVDRISDDEIYLAITSTGITYSFNIKTTKSTMNLILGMNVLGQHVNVELSMNYETIKEITKPDISKSKDIDSLTDKEIEGIKEKLRDNKALLKLIDETKLLETNEA